jgi:EpsI family protein
MKSIQLWVVLLFLAAAAVLLHLRGDVDRVPASQPLSQLSPTIGSWTGTDIPLDANVLEVLGKGVFLNRMYMPDAGFSRVGTGGGNHLDAPVGLFIGYFPTQRTGQAIHSPQNCLPGAGWTFDQKGVTEFTDSAGKTYRVGEYLISNGKTRQEVLYWYRSHGRSIANDYMAKLYTLADSIRYNRTDAALVRVITPVEPGETQHDAHLRVLAFATQMAPLLPAYLPD